MMNLLIGIDKIAPQASAGSIGADGSNSTDVATASASSMHQKKGNSASFTLKQRDAEVMQNAGSASLNNDKLSRLDNFNSNMPLAINSTYDHSMDAYIGIKAGSREGEDDALPSTSGMSESLKSVKDNVNVEEACINENNQKNFFMCLHFKKLFSDTSDLERHRLEQHTKKECHNCTVCGKNFSLYPALVRHFRSLHPSKVLQFTCHDCREVFFSKSHLKKHCDYMHKVSLKQPNVEAMRSTANASLGKDKLLLSGNSNVDKFCVSVGGLDIEKSGSEAGASETNTSKGFGTTKTNINVQQDGISKKRRKKRKKKIALYFCSFCTKSFSLKGALVRHNIKKHGVKGKYICIECGMSFGQNFRINIHMDLEHNNKECKYKCSECIKSFDLLCNIKIHMKKEHQLTLTPHDIDVMKDTENASLNKDQTSISGTIKFDEYFDSVGGIDIGNDGMKNYLCPGMDDGCDDLEGLEKNLVLCEDVTSKCLEGTNDNLNMEQDITDDTNGKLLCCYCGQKFSNELHKLEHIKDQHIGENIDHVCFLCGAIFTVSFSLKRHWYTRHVNKGGKCKCSLCDKTFPFQYLLDGHWMKMHDKKDFPYVCVECNFSSLSHYIYKKHNNSKAHINNINKAANNS